MNKIYQLKIILDYIEPPIWRRVLVKSDILLPDLHKIIQIVMGWTNSHLHQFVIKGKFYGESQIDENEELGIIEYSSIKLEDIIKKARSKFQYEYDFGDSWMHTIILEKVLPAEKCVYYPQCIEGERNCPPEDCGGIPGYENLLQIIQDPENEEYEGMMEWLGGKYNPEYFDLTKINKTLKKKNFGINELL